MSIHFTCISMAIKLNAAAILWLKIVLNSVYEYEDGDYCAEDVSSQVKAAGLDLTLREAESLKGLAEENQFLCEQENTPGVVYFSSHSANVEAIATLAQILIRRFQLKPIGFCYACTADKFSLDAYGGGAYWITADEIEHTDAQNWLTERINSVEPSAT